MSVVYSPVAWFLVPAIYSLCLSVYSFTQVWWVWCAWWNTETRGWHTEGCTITDLSMRVEIGNGLGDNTPTKKRLFGRDAVVQCECVMPSDASKESFKGSFGVIKENKEDQKKRLENQKGDAGSLVGYIFNRIAESFNIKDIRKVTAPPHTPNPNPSHTLDS